jgi:hypothetical protein
MICASAVTKTSKNNYSLELYFIEVALDRRFADVRRLTLHPIRQFLCAEECRRVQKDLDQDAARMRRSMALAAHEGYNIVNRLDDTRHTDCI